MLTKNPGEPLNLNASQAVRDAPEDDDGKVPLTVRLTERHMAYLEARAANHGETPERHLETILRNFRAYHDDRRPEHHQAAPQPGMPATTRRL
jgi:hypothetical protein